MAENRAPDAQFVYTFNWTHRAVWDAPNGLQPLSFHLSD
jgi:hypothetical protein